VTVIEGLLQRFGEVRAPVAVAPVDRQAESTAVNLSLQGSLQVAVLLVDWAHSPEVPVVVGDLFETLVRDAAARVTLRKKGITSS